MEGLGAASAGGGHCDVEDGFLDIDFIRGKENPKVSAIEVWPVEG